MPESSSPPAPGSLLRVGHRRPRPDVAVVAPVGEMDAVGAPSVAGRIAELAPSCNRMVLDMRRVTFLDARGIHALLDGAGTARRHGIRLIVVGLDATSHRLLRICGVEAELTLTDVADGERATGVEL